MSEEKLPKTVEDLLSEIHKIIAKGGDYIFRGEAKDYGEVSSTLYRTRERILNKEKIAQGEGVPLTMDEIQQRNITDAKQYTTEENDKAILERIQHYGGKTNLIDFSYDYLIALFFACDGEPNKHGRLILYDTNSIDKAKVRFIEPSEPRGRVIAQKSIFVSPKNGVLEVEQENIIPIPARHKDIILEFLQTHHGITEYTIYNDIHGYISQHEIHKEVDEHLYRGHYYSIARAGQHARKGTP